VSGGEEQGGWVRPLARWRGKRVRGRGCFLLMTERGIKRKVCRLRQYLNSGGHGGEGRGMDGGGGMKKLMGDV